MSKPAAAASHDGVNRAKPYQLMLFPLNNGATNVYFVLILSYVAQFGSSILKLGMFASIMVTVMRIADAVTDPIIGAMMDRTSTRIGKFRPFMILGSAVMAISVIILYCLLPLIPESMMALRYISFTLVYFIWVLGYTFQTSCTRAGQTVLTNDPSQRPLFTIFNTIGSLLGMGVMQFMIPLVKAGFDVKDEAGVLISSGYANPELYRIITPIGIAISVLLTALAIIGIAEKDRPEYYGIGGKDQKKVKFSEYVQILNENKPMQRLMVAGRGLQARPRHRDEHHRSARALRHPDGQLQLPVPADDGSGLCVRRSVLPALCPHLSEEGTKGFPHPLCFHRAPVLRRRACPAALQSERQSGAYAVLPV